jgi:hypothetical protein
VKEERKEGRNKEIKTRKKERTGRAENKHSPTEKIIIR